VPSVADLLIEGLAEAGGRRLFGVPARGSAGALFRAAAARGLPGVPVHSAFAACVMAAVSGELGPGPGAAAVLSAPAALSGLAHARRDRAPMILLTEPGGSPPFEGDALAKQSLPVGPDSAAREVVRAAELATAEPRGPVHLALPQAVAERIAVPGRATVGTRPPLAPDVGALDAATALIEAASRPLVVAGLGCRGDDGGWVRALAEALPAPVVTTLKGKGTIPEPHPLALGILGGGAPEEPIVYRADLVIAVGLDPVELGGAPWPYGAKVLHVGRAPHTGQGYVAAVEVVGEPGLVLAELAPRLRGRARADWDVTEVDRARRARAARLAADASGLAPNRIAQIARELTPAGTIAAVEGCPAMLGVALGWQAVAPGECLVPNALGTAGFALPAAIAAQLAHPGRRLLCFTDPGGLLRVLGELETAARLALPIVVLLLGAAGADFGSVARSVGMLAAEAADAGAARRALAELLARARPALLDLRGAA
jgi:acetolactate synthase I/II/III large subunit